MTNLLQGFFMADIIKLWKFLLMLQKMDCSLFTSIGAKYTTC